MRLLLDTHALIWWWAKGGRLPANALALLSAPDNIIVVSAVSAWEMATKYRLGKLPEAQEGIDNFEAWATRDAMTMLPVTHDHALLAGGFAAEHADPFDRMLAAQAIVEGIPMLSRDTALDAFGCERIWE